MFFLVYKITNLITNKVYIGVHKTVVIDDGYMGSSKKLKEDIKELGKQNFKKEIIVCCKDIEEMLQMEEDLVNSSYLEGNVYNVIKGGKVGYIDFNKDFINIYGNNGYHPNSLKNILGFKNVPLTEEVKEKLSISIKAWCEKNPNAFLGKKHSEETRKLIGQKSSVHQSGEKNSQFGTRWITNSETGERKKVKNDTLVMSPWIVGHLDIEKLKKQQEVKEARAKEKATAKQKQELLFGEMYKFYKENGWPETQRKFNYSKSRIALLNQFVRYVPEYAEATNRKRFSCKKEHIKPYDEREKPMLGKSWYTNIKTGEKSSFLPNNVPGADWVKGCIDIERHKRVESDKELKLKIKEEWIREKTEYYEGVYKDFIEHGYRYLYKNGFKEAGTELLKNFKKFLPDTLWFPENANELYLHKRNNFVRKVKEGV